MQNNQQFAQQQQQQQPNQQKQQPVAEFKMVMVGDGGVGKNNFR